MIIDLDKELRLSKFRKIIKLLSKSSRVIKVSVNGDLYDITKVIDKKDVTIFVVGSFEDNNG